MLDVHTIICFNTYKNFSLQSTWLSRLIVTKNSVALSLRANYTDWSTATCQRNLVSTFVDRGVSRGQRDGSPTVVNLRTDSNNN
jgi:hypothetical protein